VALRIQELTFLGAWVREAVREELRPDGGDAALSHVVAGGELEDDPVALGLLLDERERVVVVGAIEADFWLPRLENARQKAAACSRSASLSTRFASWGSSHTRRSPPLAVTPTLFAEMMRSPPRVFPKWEGADMSRRMLNFSPYRRRYQSSRIRSRDLRDKSKATSRPNAAVSHRR
jgi:hypothetical protein